MSQYNERLFAPGIRGRYHSARYHWVSAEISKLGLKSPRIVELGCYDAKTLEYLAERPSYYLGLDANWEGGVDIGRKKWAERSEIELIECTRPDEIPERDRFDIGICLETLEHIPDQMLLEYLKALQGMVKGKLFITVPIERGFVFLFKALAKRLARATGKGRYSATDIWYLTIGRTDKVVRDNHRGFDDRKLISILEDYFTIDKVCGVFPGIPIAPLNLTVGIVVSPKTVAVPQPTTSVIASRAEG